MNIISILVTLLTMDSLIFSLSIPQVERKSWIRHRSKRECEGPDCLSSEEDSANNRNAASCSLERREKLGALNSTAAREFIPKCEKDGSYSSMQCHTVTKSCWCVTEFGKPIPGTTLLILSPSSKRPNCAKYHPAAKSATRRRSSQAKKNRKSCNHGDRAQFNAALIKTFKGEFSRFRMISAGYKNTGSSSEQVEDDEVLYWKFSYLDRNNDSYLEKNETMILKRLVKQQIQPRQCAKTFISFCANGDKKITKKEWLDCLRIGSTENRSTRGMHPFQLLKQGNAHSTGDATPLISPNSRKDSDHREVSNCRTDRQSALDSRKSGSNETVIIPECNPNGLYQRTQCSQGKPKYCWCVFEETGMQIPETVEINSIPDCDKKVAVYKSIQGCSGSKRAKFLTDLLDSMRIQMNDSLSRQQRIQSDPRSLRRSNEDVVRWHYNRLDVNQNNVLERREWKLFKNEIIQKGHLRRCGKRLPRICDKNQDKKLTLTEWLECLGVKSSPESRPVQGKKPVHKPSGPRSGKNPFTTILKQ